MKPDIKGLTKLARVIARVPRNKFNMGHWWKAAPCGTSGCIAGHAAALFPHRFKKEAYYPSWDDTADKEGVTDYDVVHRRTGTTGEVAFADGFHISDEAAAKLTLYGMRRTPQQAAAAIMKLVGRLKKDLKK